MDLNLEKDFYSTIVVSTLCLPSKEHPEGKTETKIYSTGEDIYYSDYGCYNFELVRGESFSFGVKYLNENDEVINLENYKITCIAESKIGSFEINCIYDSKSEEIKISLSSEESNNIYILSDSYKYYYKLFIHTGEYSKCIMYGNITVRE